MVFESRRGGHACSLASALSDSAVVQWRVPAWPSGELYFNPLAWQVLFVFGAWYAYEGAGRLSAIVRSRVALVLAMLYLMFSLAVALSWQIEALQLMMPDWLSALTYPIDKSHLSPLRLLHFLALAVVVSRLTPPDWMSALCRAERYRHRRLGMAAQSALRNNHL